LIDKDKVVFAQEGFADEFALVSNDQHNRRGACGAARLNNPVHHRLACDGVQNLGEIAAHSRAFAGGEDDCGAAFVVL
jgi:hypothetical protein